MYGISVKSINPTIVCEKLTNQKGRVSEGEALQHVLNREVERKASKSGLLIPGIESMKMSIAHCCQPVYGDDIVGFITKGEGVKVHRRDCVNVNVEGARLIDVQWAAEDAERTYDSDLVVESKDRNFLLTDIVTVVSQCKMTLETVNASINHDTLITTIKMTVRVRNKDALENLMANLRKVDAVLYVERDNH
jgi:GTP pyrophosphokinase